MDALDIEVFPARVRVDRYASSVNNQDILGRIVMFLRRGEVTASVEIQDVSCV